MSLPEKLQQAIEAELEHYDRQGMAKARLKLTESYRQGSKSQHMSQEADYKAYLATRLPATYAVIVRVLEEIRKRAPEWQVKSVLDLGAGPGTAMWAAQATLPHLQNITLLEKDSQLIALGKRLAAKSESSILTEAKWQMEDLEHLSVLPPHDLVILSYSIGELSGSVIPLLIEKCWQASKQFLIVIEPGTPQGFERIRAIRRQLIELKAFIVAPCPHALECPMKGGDWCHFAERVERSSLHRRLKEGTLGYEDEKFSYIAVAKFPAHLPKSRVLRHPSRHSGHVNLTLCTPEGLKQETISKRTPKAYKQARKVEWGSPFPPNEEEA